MFLDFWLAIARPGLWTVWHRLLSYYSLTRNSCCLIKPLRHLLRSWTVGLSFRSSSMHFVKWAFVFFFAPRIIFTFLKVFETLALSFTNAPVSCLALFPPSLYPLLSFFLSLNSHKLITERRESYVIMEDEILRYDSYEVVQALVSIDSISSFKLRLNQRNKPSSRIASFKPL